MSRIRATNTRPELVVRGMLDGRVFRYQPTGVKGNPDFANKRRRVAVFVDGCFWHGCPKCYIEPKSNKKFWREKIRRNMARDRKYSRALRDDGWVVVRVWEHSIRKSPRSARTKIFSALV